MAETRTSRFGLVQWGVGTDSPSRIDFNEAFLNLESRAAYDDGVTRASLPVINVVAGRSVLVVNGANKTLYRRSDAGSWDYVGGSTVPETLTVRPAAGVGGSGPALTANALVISHPDNASAPGAAWAWDGSSVIGGTQRVFDGNDGTKGTVIIGASLALAADPVVNGRLHVRTRANTERGIVVRPHASTAGPTLALQDASGTDVLTVDSTGRLQQNGASAFGGASLSADSAVSIAPTPNTTDGFTNGLLLHGHAAPADTKTIMQVLRQADDSAALMTVGRDNIGIGRLPWGSTSANGVVSQSGRQLANRATGYTSDAVLWKLTRADLATPSNTGLDEPVVAFSRASTLVRTPATITQALGTGSVNLTLKRYTDLTQRFLELHRMGASETIEVVGAWDSEGRAQSGVRWQGAGAMRDVRQELRHRTTKTISVTLNPNETASTTYAVMQCRSATACDLAINMRLQCYVEAGAFSDKEDGQQWFLNCDIAVNGGSFTFLGNALMGGPSHRDGTRPTVVQTGDFVVSNIPAGATFQLRSRILIGSAVPRVGLQTIFVNVSESVIANYTS